MLRSSDIGNYHSVWDQRIIPALKKVADVQQPLMKYMEDATRKRLRAYLCGEESYTSVCALRYHGNRRASEVRAETMQLHP